MEENIPEFQYLIALNPPFLVVTFVGPMSKESLPKLTECEKEILSQENIKSVVLYFRDVSNVTMDVIPFITSFQMKLRSNYNLQICSLRPDIKEKLSKLGIIRALELSNNLQDALKLLKQKS